MDEHGVGLVDGHGEHGLTGVWADPAARVAQCRGHDDRQHGIDPVIGCDLLYAPTEHLNRHGRGGVDRTGARRTRGQQR